MKNSDPGFPMMEFMTVRTVREYLQSKKSLIVPVGVIEQHGYHLPLKTDAIIAEDTAKLIGQETGTLVAPVMYESFSGGGLPGTVNVSPAVMSLVIADRLISYVSQGFKIIYIYLCHGGSENARALGDALKLLLRLNPAFQDVMIVLLPCWELDADGVSLKKGFTENDWHAGWIETSMIMALRPHLVQMEHVAIDEEPYFSLQIQHPDNYQHAEKIVDDPAVVGRYRQRPQIKVGVMGFPKRASAETGKAIIASILKAAKPKIAALEAQYDGKYKEVEFQPEPLIF